MENKITEINPEGIAFALRAYNAKNEGGWIDLINTNNNQQHVDYIKLYPEIDLTNIARLNFQFGLGVDHLRTRIEINGYEFVTGRFFSPYQFQMDIIALEKYFPEIKSLRIFLPYQTYSVDVTAVKADKETDQTKTLEIKEQYCVVVKNNSRNTQRLDLLNPPSHLQSLYDYDVLFNDLHDYSKVKIFSNSKQNQKKQIVLTFKEAETLMLLITNGMQPDSFQPSIQDYNFRAPINLAELQNFFIDLYPNEEAMFYFYND